MSLGKWILCGPVGHPGLPTRVLHGTGPPSCAGLPTHLGQDLLGQFSCPVVGSIALLILGHSVIHQPEGLGLCPTQSSASEDELLRQGHPQAPRQPLGPSCQDGMGMVSQHGKWEPREGPGWASAKTSQKQILN